MQMKLIQKVASFFFDHALKRKLAFLVALECSSRSSRLEEAARCRVATN